MYVYMCKFGEKELWKYTVNEMAKTVQSDVQHNLFLKVTYQKVPSTKEIFRPITTLAFWPPAGTRCSEHAWTFLSDTFRVYILLGHLQLWIPAVRPGHLVH